MKPQILTPMRVVRMRVVRVMLYSYINYVVRKARRCLCILRGETRMRVLCVACPSASCEKDGLSTLCVSDVLELSLFVRGRTRNTILIGSADHKKHRDVLHIM